MTFYCNTMKKECNEYGTSECFFCLKHTQKEWQQEVVDMYIKKYEDDAERERMKPPKRKYKKKGCDDDV